LRDGPFHTLYSSDVFGGRRTKIGTPQSGKKKDEGGGVLQVEDYWDGRLYSVSYCGIESFVKWGGGEEGRASGKGVFDTEVIILLLGNGFILGRICSTRKLPPPRVWIAGVGVKFWKITA